MNDSLVANVHGEGSVDRAAVSSVVILGLQVSLSALGVTSLAVDRRAVAVGLGGLDGEAVLGELGVAAHVDARHVPVDGVAGLGVLELQDVILVGLGRQLDGHAAAVAVLAPRLMVGTTARRKGLHISSTTGDGPRVDSVVQVVDDLDAAAAAAAGGAGSVAGLDAVGEGCGEGSKEGSSETELGEHHFERREWCAWKSKVK